MEVNSLIKWYSKISTSESFDEKESSGQWRRETSLYVEMTKTTNRGWTVLSSGYSYDAFTWASFFVSSKYWSELQAGGNVEKSHFC